MKRQEVFVSTGWLADHLDDEGVRVLDASWHLPGAGRNAEAEYIESHIPGAGFFDLDAVSDPATSLPHMLPSEEDFSRHMRRLGISNHQRVVVYDTGGLHAAVRAWWMFGVFSHQDARILDGGLERWRAEGRPLAAGAETAKPGHFTARYRPEMVASKADVQRALAAGTHEIIDARSAGRFEGREEEPRPGVRRGHVPGSKNLHYARLFDRHGGFADDVRLKALAAELGLDPGKPVYTLCGSGVTACIVALGLNFLGREDVRVYDGSWVEWGSDPEAPIAEGGG